MNQKTVIMSGSVLLVGLLISIPTHDSLVKHTKNHALISHISKEYKVDVGKVSYLVARVEDETKKDFPSKIDVLSIIAIESRFKTDATSNKGAKGWMQIRYKKVANEYENILAGIELLTTYRRLLGSERAAIQAYNVGIKNYRDGMRNEKYYQNYFKTKKELIKYEC